MRPDRALGALGSLLVAALALVQGCGGAAPESASAVEQTGAAVETSASADPNTAAAPAEAAPGAAPPGAAGPLSFVDVTQEAGIRFKHNSGAFGKKYLPETMGAGCAFLDYDNDGWQDVLLVNSADWPERKRSTTTLALYRNGGNGTFADVTAEAGLAVEIYGLGCAVADYDNDGNQDVYITALGPNRLFRNTGGRFVDVTAKTGTGDPGFSTGAAWLDYDRDGRLDLFVCNYVDWSVETDIRCSLDGKNKSYCTPEAYKGQSPSLYRNRGFGAFENVTVKAGLSDPTCKALGVALVDFDEDGWLDLFVSNDTQPNRLYRNNGDGTFADVALEAGVAFSDAGTARAGMGVDAADFDGSGRPGLVVGNFTNEKIALYKNEGSGLFSDVADKSAVGKASAPALSFATFFFDYDLDGWLDLFVSNGHVSDDIAVVQPTAKYAQRPLVFNNRGGGRFEEAALGAALGLAVVGRGAAYGDYDNDGDPDLLVMANNGPARLLRNDGGSRNAALRIRAIGTTANRDAVGALVSVRTLDGRVLERMVKTGSSYCSQSETVLTFGLGQAEAVAGIDVVWPGGRAESFPGTAANQRLTITEGAGVVSAEPLRR